ncbi:hypothetical protein CFS9_39160 [Flavobacterium sp. CFS9]|uniref:Uncharacterized protein n=1 Tax=Flavobacterium sp. CFS9 TaxID=3143118 RepID=A0AAT9H741_9FLAO
MSEIILDRPKITDQLPVGQLTFGAIGNKLVSQTCQLTIEVTFTNGVEMDCALRVSIDKTRQSNFTMDPNTVNSNKHEIYRYYGKVGSGKTDTFKFRLKSVDSFKNPKQLQKLQDDIRAFASPIPIIITVYDCSSNDIKKSDFITWKIA